MTDKGTWRPLGAETEDEIAEYDALHDGVPTWMEPVLWSWVEREITSYGFQTDYQTKRNVRVKLLKEYFVEDMCQTLRIPFDNLPRGGPDPSEAKERVNAAMILLRRSGKGLHVADYVLAHMDEPDSTRLESLLAYGKSLWTVGTRYGRPGLVRRIPEGVQAGADTVMQRTGRAGARLAKAWESLYTLDPNPSEAYGLAIKAVEDAAIPVVSPANDRATLGTVLSQIENQRDWALGISREDIRAPSRDVLVGMMRTLWHGQHDRHGGQSSAPGNVTESEAIVAVGLATTLVHWFDAGVVKRHNAE